ncbi:ROK family transcriptional regulator [Parafrigoribacterium mesophilum]|uniref:ROK family transcriptional regulator n=1 Tax=Parafrigoribacterium mesophilum TaxID=433646 RepID=UPI0031FC01D5
MSTKTVPGTPSWLRERNERTALSLLFDHGVLTRNRIGELSGLSKPTASQIVARLEGAGLIEVVGEVSAGRGPNALSYGVRADRVLGVAIDIDEKVIRSTVVDATGTEYPVVETVITNGDNGHSAASDVQDAITAASDSAAVDSTAVRVVAIGVQGSIDPRTDKLSFIDTLPGWPRQGIRTHLETLLGLDVHIDNDANLAAIAERSEGAGAGTGSFALLWLGPGLGLAVDLAGAVHRGAAGGAGEIGYLPVPWNAVDIDPQAHDLQQLIGGPAAVAIARSHGVAGDTDGDVIDALGQHPARESVFTEVARRIALGVVPVLAILDPELIVLGGPIGTSGGPLLAELVRAEIERTTLWHPRATQSLVPVYPVLRGAREVLVHQVRQHLFDELDK